MSKKYFLAWLLIGLCFVFSNPKSATAITDFQMDRAAERQIELDQRAAIVALCAALKCQPDEACSALTSPQLYDSAGKNFCFKTKIPCGEAECEMSEYRCKTEPDCLIKGYQGKCTYGNYCYFTPEVMNLIKNAPGILEPIANLKIQSPILELRIPGLNFSPTSNTIDSEGNIYIPYIGELISAIFRYGLAIGSILAVIMIIISGVRIVASAGGEEKTTGYKQIGKTVIGLFLLWGSYGILYTINPVLVNLRILKIKYVAPIPLENFQEYDAGAEKGSNQAGYIKYECKHQPANATLGDNTYDDIFQKYGECITYDWRLLKAMSFVESAHRPTVTNCFGFTGLYQTKTKYANSFTARYKMDFGKPADFEAQGKVNPALTDPDKSAAVGTAIVIGSLSIITAACPNIPPNDIYYFLYVGHQSGTGALQRVVKTSCDPTKAPETIKSFYSNTKLNRTPDEIANEADTGAKKLIKFIKTLGASDQTKVIDKNKCPLKN